MAIDIYFYANGNDPFVFPLGDYIVHVHAGAPPREPSPGPEPTSNTVRSPDLVSTTPTLSAYPHKTPVGPPIALTHVFGEDEMRDWMSQVELQLGDEPVHFRLDAVSGPYRPEIGTLLDGLQGFSGHDVNVDIVCWSEPVDG